MTEIKNEATISNKEVTINRQAIEHRAIWMGHTFEEAKEAGADGEAFTRRAVSKTGCMHGKKFKEACSKPLKVNEFAEEFLPPLVRETFEMDVKTCTEDTLEIEFHYCPLVAGWLKAGIPLEDIPVLCDVAMDGDRSIAKTVGLEFTLGKTIAKGDPICELYFSKEK